MNHSPINTAGTTIAGVLTDLREVQRHLVLPMDELETERTARILDRLSEELTEAAAAVRASR
jgi:hypothetical protein